MHKRIFANVFNPNAAEPTKEAARKLFEPTLDYLAQRLGSGEYLVGNKFTVADAYLVTLLNWFVFLKVDLKKWPTIAAYHTRAPGASRRRPGDGRRDGRAPAPRGVVPEDS